MELKIIPSKKTHFVLHSLFVCLLYDSSLEQPQKMQTKTFELSRTHQNIRFLSKHSKLFLNGMSSFSLTRWRERRGEREAERMEEKNIISIDVHQNNFLGKKN